MAEDDTEGRAVVEGARSLFEYAVRHPASPTGPITLAMLSTSGLTRLNLGFDPMSGPTFMQLGAEKQKTDSITGAETFPSLRSFDIRLSDHEPVIMHLPRLEELTLRQGCIPEDGLCQLLGLRIDSDHRSQRALRSLILLGVENVHEAVTTSVESGQLGKLDYIYIQDTFAPEKAIATLVQTAAMHSQQISTVGIDQAFKEADYDSSSEPEYYGYGPPWTQFPVSLQTFKKLKTLMICRDLLSGWDISTIDDPLKLIKQFVTEGPTVSLIILTGLFLEDLEAMTQHKLPHKWPDSFHELTLCCDFGWVRGVDLLTYVENFTAYMDTLIDAGA
jgi:hypothetical protein